MTQSTTSTHPVGTLTKLDLAVSNIASAMQMIGFRISPYAVHLIMMSVDEVIIKCAQHRNVALPYDPPDRIKREHINMWYRLKKNAANFMKHADRDPDGVYDGPPDKVLQMLNDMTIFFALTGLKALGHEVPQLFNAFPFAFYCRYPHLAKWDEIYTNYPALEEHQSRQDIQVPISRRDYEAMVQMLCNRSGINDITF